LARVRSRPRPGSATRPRGGRAPRSAGRRRTSSAFDAAGNLLFRLETVGLALLFLALVSIPFLVPATRGLTDLRDSIVRTFGLMVFAFIGLLAYVGLIVVRRQLDETFASWKPWRRAHLSRPSSQGCSASSSRTGSLAAYRSTT
jgi:hypothetical protein